jgi:hypothetical protein
MKRVSTTSGLSTAIVFATTTAWGFSEATHAYIADNIGRTTTLANAQEMYGAMVSDAFNSELSGNWDEALRTCVRNTGHGYPLTGSTDFMTVWNQAGLGQRPAAALFVAHNDIWGADSFAHWTTSAGTEPGYIVAKATDIVFAIDAIEDENGQSAWEVLGIPADPFGSQDPLADPAELIAHFVVEKMGDVVIEREDPEIPRKLLGAALLRGDNFRDLMVSAFSQNCGVDPAFVSQIEAQFRSDVMLRAVGMMQGEGEFLVLLHQQLAEMAPEFLESATGQPYDPALDPVVDQLLWDLIDLGLDAVEDDFMTEIDGVIAALPDRLAANGVVW